MDLSMFDMNFVMYGIMFLTTLWVMFLLSSHRILIKKMYVVTDGFVMKSGRYKKVFDKKLNLEYLKPMLGKKWLPVAKADAFQDMSSLPIIGTKSIATYVFCRSLPGSFLYPDGTQEKIKLKRWVYMRERAKVKKEEIRTKFVSFMETYAAALIILMTGGFFILMIIFEYQADQTTAAKLTELTNYALHMLGK